MTDSVIYLDNQATTPLDPRVLDAMMPYLADKFGNPHSSGHAPGRDAAAAVEVARGQVAAIIGAEPREIIFTSGATEANNLAIKGAARFLKGRKSRIVTLATEHKCVLESALDLRAEGFEIDILPVESSGRVDLARLDAALNAETTLVSVMAVNNEIGVIQDLAAIGALAKQKGALFHTDAAQAFGKIPLDVGKLGVDLLSISGHKIYGPKGIGALYVRHRPRVRLTPLFSGGGQERGWRSGTLAPFLCVALGEAAWIAQKEMTADDLRIGGLARRLRSAIEAKTEGVILNGDAVHRLASSLNLQFPGIRAVDLLAGLPELALSVGSACNSAEVEPSYVLTALGLTPDQAGASVRISLGRFTTEDEVDRAAALIAEAVRQYRATGDARHA